MESEAIAQAYASLTMHEFVLEALMANWLAGMAPADANRFLEQFQDRMTRPWIPSDSAVEESVAKRIIVDAATLGDRFAEKVRQREAEIREELARRARRP